MKIKILYCLYSYISIDLFIHWKFVVLRYEKWKEQRSNSEKTTIIMFFFLCLISKIDFIFPFIPFTDFFFFSSSLTKSMLFILISFFVWISLSLSLSTYLPTYLYLFLSLFPLISLIYSWFFFITGNFVIL